MTAGDQSWSARYEELRSELRFTGKRWARWYAHQEHKADNTSEIAPKVVMDMVYFSVSVMAYGWTRVNYPKNVRREKLEDILTRVLRRQDPLGCMSPEEMQRLCAGRYNELVRELPFIGKHWLRKYARSEFKIQNSRMGTPRLLFKGLRYTIAYTVQGQLKDDYSSKLEDLLTHVPKIQAQDVNAPLSIAETLIVSGFAYDFVDLLGGAGDKSLYFTVPFGVVGIASNIYRVAKRDGKARPAIGYGSALAHAVGLVAEDAKALPSALQGYVWRAKREGTNGFYAALKTIGEDAISTAKADAKRAAEVAAQYTARAAATLAAIISCKDLFKGK